MTTEAAPSWWSRWGAWVILGILAAAAVVLGVALSLSRDQRNRAALARSAAEVEITRDTYRVTVEKTDEEAAAAHAEIALRRAELNAIDEIEDEAERVRALDAWLTARGR